MDEQELWTQADDETIRRALDSLRCDTDALRLAEVRVVKARGNSLRRRGFVGAAAAGAAAAIVGVLGLHALGSNHSLDLSPATSRATVTQSQAPVPAADPNICGRWSSLDSPAMQHLVAVHGEFRGCLKVASGWMIVTTHPSIPGEIGIMDCRSKPACLDGRQNRDVSQFTWQLAPSGTSLSILGQNGSVFTLFNGQGEITFNSDTKKFGPTSTTADAAPGHTAATESVVIRPVDQAGKPAAGYTVNDLTKDPRNSPNNNCGLVRTSFPSAVDANIMLCSPSAPSVAFACWEAAAPAHVLCLHDPWSRELTEWISGLAPTAAPGSPLPLGLLLSDGDHCLLSPGDFAGRPVQQPTLFSSYTCIKNGAIWALGKDANNTPWAALGTHGIDRSTPLWTVQVGATSGQGPLTLRHVITAYFIGTRRT